MQETTREPENVVWQTRQHPQTDFENRLADALEEILGEGVHDLAGIVDRLNGMGFRDEQNRAWTEDGFKDELARLNG